MFEELQKAPPRSCIGAGASWPHEKGYSFFGISVRIASNSELFFSHFDLFFAGFQASLPAGQGTTFQVRIHDADPRSSGEHQIYLNRELIYRAGDYIDLFLFLEWQICGMITRTDRYLLLHAGLSARDGAGILVAGPSGAGKTTLIGGMAIAGNDYMTDEMVVIDPESRSILPFARTLNLKEEVLAGSPRLLEGLKKKNFGQKKPYLGGRWFVHAGPGRGVDAIRTVLFPAYAAGSSPTLTEMTRGRGVFLLTQNTFNLPRFREQGIDLLITITKEARFFSVTTGNLEETLARIERILPPSDGKG